MSTNPERVARSEAALQHYVLLKGEVFEGSMDEVTDLIADLLHLTASMKEKVGFADVEEEVDRTLRLARLHWDAEHNNPEEEGGE